MLRNILFIQESASFLINAIIGTLTNEGFECNTIPYDANIISKKLENYAYVFVNLEKDSVFRHSAELMLLKEQAGFHDYKIMLMGAPSDIEDCVEIIGDNYLVEIFERPINTRDVTDRISATFSNLANSAPKKTILVVDDSGTYLHTIRDWLSPYYKIIIVNSATSAIAYLASSSPDLMLLDYEMPVCSGPKLLEMIRSDPSNSNIPVMFLTGKGDRESVQKVLALRPQGYLLKSMPREKIIQTLKEFFEKLDSENAGDEDVII